MTTVMHLQIHKKNKKDILHSSLYMLQVHTISCCSISWMQQIHMLLARYAYRQFTERQQNATGLAGMHRRNCTQWWHTKYSLSL